MRRDTIFNRLPNAKTLAAVALIALLAAGCAHGPKKTAAAAPAEQQQASADNSEAAVRNDLMHAIDELPPAHFDYDSSFLREDARAVLVKNSVWIKGNPKAKIQIAGHCDQRGTVEYNLALGQRRAKAVRDYYIKLGIRAHRIATISYGKEKPLCGEMSEECRLQNRRAETLVAFPQKPAVAKTQSP